MAYLPPLNGGRLNASIGGNSTSAGAGYTMMSTGTMYLMGGNNITLSQNANSVTISGGPAGGVALANSQTTYSSGTANLSVAGGAMTIASTTGQAFNFSAPQLSSISATGNVSIYTNGNTISIGAPAYSAGISTNGNTSGMTGLATGQLLFAGGNNITLSQSTGAGGNTLTISAASQTVQTQNIHNVTVGGNTTGTLANISSGTLSLMGGNNITLSQVGNAITISGGAGGGTMGLYGVGNTTQNSSTTVDVRSVSLNGLGAMTVGYSNGSVQLSAPAVSSVSATGALSISSNGNTVSMGVPAVSFGMSNIGNTSGTSGTASNQLIFAGGNNITLSQATGVGGNTLSIVGGGGGGGIALANSQTNFTSGTVSLNVAGGALTIASSTNGASQSYNFSAPVLSSLSATGAISISTNGNTISIGAPAMFDAGISNIGNTSGTSGQNTNGLVLVGGTNITLSQSTNTAGATITILGGGGGGGGLNPVHSFYQNLVPQNSAQPYTSLGVAFKTMLVQPLSPIEGYGFPGDMTVSTFMMNLSGSATATSASSVWSASFGSSVSIGLYLLANSSQLTLVNSASTSWSASANGSNSTNWAGARFLTFDASQWSTTPALSYGERYWYGVLHASSNFSAMGPSWIGQYVGASTQRSGTIGVSQVVNTSRGMVPFLGIYSASLSSMPISLANSQINKVNVSAGFVPAVILNATISEF